ncbi:MAG: hypothetical protein SPK49_02075 [Erysipelotrichaceae bacterium]|nr:hypothetical protein [Erysipelotrichaceae bacterium]
METYKNMIVTIDEAREMYDSDNKALKDLALKVFSEDELNQSTYSEIKTFEDAVTVLGMSIDDENSIVNTLKERSKAMAAMYKLNIIRKALNLGQNLHLIKSENEDSLVYCPKNPFIAKGSTYYKNDIEWCRMEIIGRFNNDGIEYFVLNGDPGISGHSGLAVYDGLICVAHTRTEFAFLGCASAEIAEHFGKYFGMLITEAKYGDVDDFTITNDKYGNA